ncbi:hypothetical protein SDC9_163409 [bioreactor metagenome]|uniref:Uncharacterized protein n=1 Tax=bioreactor metagenome TaxID=1076179 RepID=A0A645FNR6_9ZZZZ
MGFFLSTSSKYKRVVTLPDFGSTTRSFVFVIFFGIFDSAFSSLSMARSAFRTVFFSSGAARSSFENCSRGELLLIHFSPPGGYFSRITPHQPDPRQYPADERKPRSALLIRQATRKCLSRRNRRRNTRRRRRYIRLKEHIRRPPVK